MLGSKLINKELKTIIKKKTKKDCNFELLESDEKDAVLLYIFKNKKPIKVFESIGFDVLKKTFFVNEYKKGESEIYLYDFLIERIDFHTFAEFYDYVNGYIYENSCYYGYEFSKEEISKFRIKVECLNFDSFTMEIIDNDNFESILLKNNEKNKMLLKNMDKIKTWYENLNKINTYDDLLNERKKFIRSFTFYFAEHVFFRFVMKKYKNEVKDFIMKYFCSHDCFRSIYFSELLFIYGNEVGPYVFEHYDLGQSYTTTRKHIRDFEKIYEMFQNKNYKDKISYGFEIESNLYYINSIRRYSEKESLSCTNYIFSFDDLVKKLNGDLVVGNFRDAPISKEEVESYQTSEKTIFPKTTNYEKYQIEKYYENEKFYVVQKWFDEDSNLIASIDKSFSYFCDFVHYLKGDLSEADLLFCEGIENVTKVDFSKAKLKSEIRKKLNLDIEYLDEKSLDTTSFSGPSKNDLVTVDNLYLDHTVNDDYDYYISYASDIHVIHRIKANHCASFDDGRFIIRTICNNFKKEGSEFNLIAGDIASNLNLYRLFINELEKTGLEYFITLGNHELWNGENASYFSKIEAYRKILNKPKMHLVNNNLFMIIGRDVVEIPTEELVAMSKEQLREKTRKANLIIFGGIGFSGYNDDFNALNDIYRGLIDREEEIEFSNNFCELYLKVGEALFDKNVIILTHMPVSDWCKENKMFDKFIYISGHNHKNYFYDDGIKRIYSDNQIGYKQKEAHLKKISLNRSYDWFSDYKDGIYEITKDDYKNFYRGINQYFTFERKFKKLYMIKREKVYMFFMENETGKLSLLNGGSIRNIGKHNLQYFYDNMVNYSKCVQMFLSQYLDFQKNISKEIKNIGGDGCIHGTIVDIDFFNHLYIDPLSGKITPYFAYSIIEKFVYKNLTSLLFCKRQDLYQNYVKEIAEKAKDNKSPILVDAKDKISKDTSYESSTEMYRISRIVKGLQYTTNHNVVRIWNDALIQQPSAVAGKLIIKSLINPDGLEVKKR